MCDVAFGAGVSTRHFRIPDEYHLHPQRHNRDTPAELDTTRPALSVNALTVQRCQPGHRTRRGYVPTWTFECSPVMMGLPAGPRSILRWRSRVWMVAPSRMGYDASGILFCHDHV
jgi:hypothetical protein